MTSLSASVILPQLVRLVLFSCNAKGEADNGTREEGQEALQLVLHPSIPHLELRVHTGFFRIPHSNLKQ